MSNSFSNDDLQTELIKDFIIESVEGLDLYDQKILDFENEADLGTMNVIFRVIHTIKGTAGCLALPKIESVSHAGENLLSMIREGEITPNKSMITTLLSLSDALRESIQILEQTGREGDQDFSDLLAQLDAHQKGEALPTPEPEPEEQAYGLFEDEEETPAEQADEAWGLFGDEEEETTPQAETESKEPATAQLPANTGTSLAESSIRIGVTQLDKVMNIVGELVLARNQIVLNTTNFDEAALLKASQRLNIITTELQENVMKTRMQPIGNVWAKFPRVVRDVSNELGKEVRLIMDGQDTELDRTVIEAIKDPLTHIVRNSIDHGIESPEQRLASHKPAEGLLSLRAYHEGGQIIIEIMDDGAGINVERVKDKAVSRGLITSAHAANLTEKEAINLVFQPGFSTAEKVSNVSGRGVGMDVVRTNIEKSGGTVDLSSEAGQGTTVKIKIPLTLAIIPALTVTTSGDRYAIPQVSLLELVRLEGEAAHSGIEELYGSPIYRLRGKLLPIIFLNEQLRTEALADEADDEDKVVNIVVLQADGRQFGLVVDEINDTEEIVVKPLSKQLKGIPCFAGATIMGDGKVALILDVMGIAQHSRVVSENADRTISSQEETETVQREDTETLLLFSIGSDNRIAIPLNQAARLEEFEVDTVEHSGRHQVVQYRGEILPLIEIADYVPTSQPQADKTSREKLQVIVYSTHTGTYGLIVDQIQDIVEQAISARRESRCETLAGSIVLQGHVTDLLDAEAIIERYESGAIPQTV
ncbi:chemotaxis protein CheA [Pelagicoccus mobilis]|uniref:histidine kinase n=1 Tax=Pelagicoccus mobilis TaxID=415221 RepID=A0A934RZ95_9BACT|nr:chemotaxis protein CheA [Pelagicoccus mobilis]MBK1878265.1 chemotaxis protein CheA [Pelagicoccus mobilis]